ncbi:MAG: magnesium/cobalt transporter CorA [Candidatus Zixiibacteriota bacterium]
MIRYFYHTPGSGVKAGEGSADFGAMLKHKNALLWVDMSQPGKEEESLLSEIFKLHPLAVEDAFLVNQVSKIDEYGEDLFAVFKLIDYQGEDDELKVSEVDIFVNHRFVVTVHQERHRVFDYLYSNAVGNQRMMSRGADLLFHAIVDAVIDSFNITLDVLESQVDDIEEHVLSEPDENIVRAIFRVRRNMSLLKRVASPQKETLYRLSRQKLQAISDRARIYFRDIFDNVTRINDIADSNRETLSAALEVYYSSVSTKTNEIIKFLTLITVILMPPTFLVGLWGMNFRSMPELQWEHGYLFFWLVILLTTGSLLLLFRKKKWL